MKNIAELPVLGVGASLSLSEQPDPVSLVLTEGGPSFVEYAGLVDVERVIGEVSRIRAAGAPVLYHPSHINFCGSYANSDKWLEATARHIEAVSSPWFAQDCAYCFWGEDYGYSTQMGYFVPPVFNEPSLRLAVERVKEVQLHMAVPVAIEPPPMTFMIGGMPLLQFFGDLARETDCAILLDMGHLVSYEMACGRRIVDELDGFPVERVIEVHIAGGKLRKGEAGPVYIDAHEREILDETWSMFEEFLPRLPGVKAVCYECEGVDESSVLNILKLIRAKIVTNSSSGELVTMLEQQ